MKYTMISEPNTMHMMAARALVALTLTLTLTIGCIDASAVAPKPHVLFLLIDDLGHAELG